MGLDLSVVPKKFQDRWNESSLTPLRAAVLRDLKNFIHAKRSRLLSEKEAPPPAALHTVQDAIGRLAKSDWTEGTLYEALQNSNELPPTQDSLPVELETILDPQKILRFDRVWEKRILASGLKLGWNLWTLDLWAKISAIKELDRELGETLWPEGLVLFVEEAPKDPDVDALKVENDESYWWGRWWLIHKNSPSFHDLSQDPRVAQNSALSDKTTLQQCFPPRSN